jgi:hypothetical protein
MWLCWCNTVPLGLTTNFSSFRDGTLITQRLHYAPSPHPYRHVLGWYHLARELNENKIFAVCIFDGEKRSKAKDREVWTLFTTSSNFSNKIHNPFELIVGKKTGNATFSHFSREFRASTHKEVENTQICGAQFSFS